MSSDIDNSLYFYTSYDEPVDLSLDELLPSTEITTYPRDIIFDHVSLSVAGMTTVQEELQLLMIKYID